MRHPLTGAPLHPLGHRRNGSPIWPVLGGSSAVVEGQGQQAGAEAGQTAAGGQQQGSTLAQSVAAAQGQQAGQQQPAQGQQAATTEPTIGDADDATALATRYTPDQLAHMALRYRREAGDNRQQAGQAKTAAQEAQEKATQAAEVEKAIKAALVSAGLAEPDEDLTDPTKLAEKLAADQAKEAARVARETEQTLQLAVYRNASAPSLVNELGSGVNVESLLDSRSFTDTLAQLDPTAADFNDKVVAAMKSAAKRNPSLKIAPVASRAGVQHAGGSGEPRRAGGAVSLADAVAAQLASQGQ